MKNKTIKRFVNNLYGRLGVYEAYRNNNIEIISDTGTSYIDTDISIQQLYPKSLAFVSSK